MEADTEIEHNQMLMLISNQQQRKWFFASFFSNVVGLYLHSTRFALQTVTGYTTLRILSKENDKFYIFGSV